MKKLSHLILQPKARVDIFEHFCEDKGIINPTDEDERSFYYKKYLNFDIRIPSFVYYKRHYDYLYERLTQSTTAEIISKDIENTLGINCYTASDSIQDIVIWFSSKDFHLEKNKVFLTILRRNNWFVLLKKKEELDYKNNTITYYLEPRKPSNKEDYIYKNCHSLIYKVVDKRRLEKILKYGLNPRIDLKIKPDDEYLVPELDSDDFRIYFIAEPSERKLQKAIQDVVINLKKSDFGRRTNGTPVEYAVIEINLNTLAELHHIIIQAYEDPRHGAPSFWTAEFIPGSCIRDVSKKFEEVL